MLMDKIHSTVVRALQERPLNNVIVRAKENDYWSVLQGVEPYVPRLRKGGPELISRLKSIGLLGIKRFNLIAALLPREIIFDLAESRAVQTIFPDYLRYANRYPTVNLIHSTKRGIFGDELQFTTTQATKKALGLDRAHDQGFNGKGITTTVLDTGASRNHEMLRGRVTTDSTILERNDFNGHGTWCCACVGGRTEIDERTSRHIGVNVVAEGMALGTKLVSIKVLESLTGAGRDSSIIAALELAQESYKSKVVSLSLGGNYEEDTPEAISYHDVFHDLVNDGVIPVVAAGNSGPDPGTVNAPGCLPDVLTIGASNPMDGSIAEFSSRGPTRWGGVKPDFVFPGVNVHSAAVGLLDAAGDQKKNRYSPLSGTSMATPHAAGLIAAMAQLYKHHNLTLNVDEIKRLGQELGSRKSNSDGWGELTWGMVEYWLETEYGVVVS